MEIIPRLTRVAGFEWGTGFYINPVPPEQAARFPAQTTVDVTAGRKVGAAGRAAPDLVENHFFQTGTE